MKLPYLRQHISHRSHGAGMTMKLFIFYALEEIQASPSAREQSVIEMYRALFSQMLRPIT